MTPEQVEDHLAVHSKDAKLLEPCSAFRPALIGVDDSGEVTVAVYDLEGVIDCLMMLGMTREEALEYFTFNIERSYIKGSPVFIRNE